MEIRELRTGEEEAWDSYVYESDASTFYHQIGWRNVVLKSYRHKPRYLVARGDDGGIVGVLPMFLMESRVFGRKLVSVPFAPYGGVCADDETVKNALVQEAKRLMKECGADYLELRTTLGDDTPGFVSRSFYVTSILELDPNPAVVRNEKLKRNKRKTIAKSEKRDLVMEWNNTTTEFYKMYVHNMRDLGSPAHSNTFFENILNEFPDNSKVLIVRRDDNVLYAAFYLFYKDVIINSWSSTLTKYRKYYPTDFGIWNAIEYSCKNGYKYYDFGRSQENSTNLEFKMRWSAKMKQLHYHYYLNNTNEVPDITTMNPKRQMFAKVWRKIPLSLADSIGPLLRRNVP